ncbi:hypothetical protein FA15DRAFT_600389 [Coprinopsis marcescibilis]|uniref:Uncharacterized protein n=1 Tax=Coprinopsis marcescibilis TaxID=230819 RepID=A0A5C3KJF3_COPMA|nr:hypothetical protein FA15DRAFT_600389 [Coprinopsis marcescibilis]
MPPQLGVRELIARNRQLQAEAQNTTPDPSSSSSPVTGPASLLEGSYDDEDEAQIEPMSTRSSPFPDNDRLSITRSSSPASFPNTPVTAPFSSGTPNPFLRRKRPAEDYTAFVSLVSREKRLKADDTKTLTQLSQASNFSPTKQNIMIMAELLAVKGTIKQITPAEAKVTLSDTVKNIVDNACFMHLLSTTAPAYVASPLVPDMVKASVLRDETLSSSISNIAFVAAIAARIQEQMSNQRCTIKAALAASLYEPKAKSDNANVPRVQLASPLNVLELSKRLMKIRKHAGVTLTLELCVRVAFLRNCLVTTPANISSRDWWIYVDTELKEVRDGHPEPAACSQFFTFLLERDMEAYGRVNLNETTPAAPVSA